MRLIVCVGGCRPDLRQGLQKHNPSLGTAVYYQRRNENKTWWIKIRERTKRGTELVWELRRNDDQKRKCNWMHQEQEDDGEQGVRRKTESVGVVGGTTMLEDTGRYSN